MKAKQRKLLRSLYGMDAKTGRRYILGHRGQRISESAAEVRLREGLKPVWPKAGKAARPVVSKRESLKMALSDWKALTAVAERAGARYVGKPSWRRMMLQIARHDLVVRKAGG